MEYFDVVDSLNRVVGKSSRYECHHNPGLPHRAVHVIISGDAEQIFLQRRSDKKDIQPGKWDTSVGGHLDEGESYYDAAVREAGEELGIHLTNLLFLYEYRMISQQETEWIRTYTVRYPGPFELCPEEITEGRFWSFAEIETSKESLFTPNFLEEYSRYKKWQAVYGHTLQRN